MRISMRAFFFYIEFHGGAFVVNVNDGLAALFNLELVLRPEPTHDLDAIA